MFWKKKNIEDIGLQKSYLLYFQWLNIINESLLELSLDIMKLKNILKSIDWKNKKKVIKDTNFFQEVFGQEYNLIWAKTFVETILNKKIKKMAKHPIVSNNSFDKEHLKKLERNAIRLIQKIEEIEKQV